jgi:hypothetical protein
MFKFDDALVSWSGDRRNQLDEGRLRFRLAGVVPVGRAKPFLESTVVETELMRDCGRSMHPRRLYCGNPEFFGDSGTVPARPSPLLQMAAYRFNISRNG